MKSYSKMLAALFAVLTTCGIMTRSADRDPYQPLKLYDGTWQVRMAGADKRPDTLVDHSGHTGIFFSCQQQLNGETRALVIFLPTGATSPGALEYRTLVARPDSMKRDDWEHLVIEGGRGFSPCVSAC